MQTKAFACKRFNPGQIPAHTNLVGHHETLPLINCLLGTDGATIANKLSATGYLVKDRAIC